MLITVLLVPADVLRPALSMALTGEAGAARAAWMEARWSTMAAYSPNPHSKVRPRIPNGRVHARWYAFRDGRCRCKACMPPSLSDGMTSLHAESTHVVCTGGGDGQ
jgi:hypothetical protein